MGTISVPAKALGNAESKALEIPLSDPYFYVWKE
jgi:hypothetical protein